MNILSVIGSRLREPSTHAGIAAIISGLGLVLQINEAQVVADAVAQVGTSYATQGWAGAAVATAGLLAVVLREGKR